MAWPPGIEEHPSPNFGPRRGGCEADMVVLHYTGMDTASAAVARLCDPASEVSAHYVICPGGQVLRLVPEDLRAWHAGVASWGGVSDINSRSIGIELVNPGHELGYPPFPGPQMESLEYILGEILSRHAIPPERVVSHACIAPGRKRDPGEKFDWRRLALRGLSVWDFAHDPGDPDPEEPANAAAFQAAARRFGYAAPETARWCDATLAVWRAFAMRYLPAQAGLLPSRAGVRLMKRLAAQWPVTGQS